MCVSDNGIVRTYDGWVIIFLVELWHAGHRIRNAFAAKKLIRDSDPDSDVIGCTAWIFCNNKPQDGIGFYVKDNHCSNRVFSGNPGWQTLGTWGHVEPIRLGFSKNTK